MTKKMPTAPSSKAPASDEASPPSKSATTRRPRALPNSISVGYTASASESPFESA
jgi:hypothetical protein